MRRAICLLSALFAVAGPAAGRAAAQAARLLVETSELAERLSDVSLRIIDARPRIEYRSGHIPGAVNLPAAATDSLDANRQGYPLPPEQAESLFRTAGINRSSQIVIYDDQGHRFAARVFYVLEFFGHPRVAVLDGGIAQWQSEGRPTTVEEPKVAAGDFQPDTKSGMIATADWVREHLNDPGVRLVDARSPAEYTGERMLGPRGGHIPGAVLIEWTRVLAGGDVPTWMEIAQLRKLFADAQVSPEQEVVAYCQMGVRASQIFFALRLLGYPRLRVYDGSWADWAANPDLPVEK